MTESSRTPIRGADRVTESVSMAGFLVMTAAALVFFAMIFVDPRGDFWKDLSKGLLFAVLAAGCIERVRWIRVVRRLDAELQARESIAHR